MRPTKGLWFFLLVVLLIKGSSSDSERSRRTLEEYEERFRSLAESRLSPSSGVKQIGRVFNPIGYGADPTGQKDSSDAILSAVNDAYGVKRELILMPGISDLGGVVIDLQGGDYKISKPIAFPSQGGNIVMHSGTLRASESFPSDRYLIELSPAEGPLADFLKPHHIDGDVFSDMKAVRNGYNYEDITFRDLLLDSSYRGGGIRVNNAVRTRIDNCFFMHFSTDGILVEKGHETYITTSFLGQHLTAGGDPLERNFSGVAIDLYSNDNIVTDVAIFSASIGVILRGQANILTGVHCYNKATYWGGIGVLVRLPKLGQTRIANCYLDYTGIVMEDPVQVHVTNGFFLGNANIVLKSKSGILSGVNIVDNMFSGDGNNNPIVKLDESNGPFTKIDQVVIDRNNVLGMKLKSTVGRMVVDQIGRKWVANFTSDLVFPNRIRNVQYSLYVRNHRKIPTHAITSVSENVVVVQSKKTIDGVVSMVVDQNSKPGQENPYV